MLPEFSPVLKIGRLASVSSFLPGSRGIGIDSGRGGPFLTTISAESRSSKAHKSISLLSLTKSPKFGRLLGGSDGLCDDGGGSGVMLAVKL
jgi:hypothetical protein